MKFEHLNMNSTTVDIDTFGVKVTFFLANSESINIEGECSILLNVGCQVRIMPKNIVHLSEGRKAYEVRAESFGGTADAEEFAARLSAALYSFAVINHLSIQIISIRGKAYQIYVVNDNRIITTINGGAKFSKGIGGLSEPLERFINSKVYSDSRLLLSLEIFASAGLETTERARFLAIVSALEPLAEQKKYESRELELLIKEMEEKLYELEMSDGTRKSLIGRVQGLKRESVTQAITRLVAEAFPGDENAVREVKAAYEIRSKILHTGKSYPDLTNERQKIETLIRNILRFRLDSSAK